MELYVYKNGKIRHWSEPPDFHSSIWGKGLLNIIRKDQKDFPNILNIEQFSVLSLNQQGATIQSPPDKKMSYHQTNVLPLELLDEGDDGPEIIISS